MVAYLSTVSTSKEVCEDLPLISILRMCVPDGKGNDICSQKAEPTGVVVDTRWAARFASTKNLTVSDE
jgi:hypothetical protein